MEQTLCTIGSQDLYRRDAVPCHDVEHLPGLQAVRRGRHQDLVVVNCVQTSEAVVGHLLKRKAHKSCSSSPLTTDLIPPELRSLKLQRVPDYYE